MNQNKSVPSGNIKTSLNSLSLFLNNPYNYLSIRIFLILLGASFLLLGITFSRLPPVVPLYYSLPWGEEQLGRSYELFIIPFSAIIFFVVNTILSLLFLKKDYFLSRILIWSSCILVFLGLFTIAKIILLVI